ncbi:MAG TPA: hypothetical protein VF945_16880 [Polyangia bacterium]
MRRALVIVLLSVAAPAAAQSLPLVPTAPAPEAPKRYPRLQPIPWFYRGIDLQRPNVGLNGRKNSIRDEQIRVETFAQPREPRPLSEW